MSQLDLALGANVSARHVSFLETSRSAPSREMVLRLGSTLGVPLRGQNELLRAAGFGAVFEEPNLERGELPPAILQAIESMLEKHEPYPMMVLNRCYDVLQANQGASRLIARFVENPEHLTAPVNAFKLLFDPRLARRFVVHWEKTARVLTSRLHREALARPEDAELASLLASLFQFAGVPEEWRQADFATHSEPILTFKLARDDMKLSFLTTVTTFNAPQNVTLEEVRLESYFPLDEATKRACEALAGG